MKIIVNEQQLEKIISEQSFDLKEKYGINNLFRKVAQELPTEDVSKEGLYESLALIGPGEIKIKDKDMDRLMYKEMLNDDKIIFIVHGSYKRSPYDKGYGYQYEIGVYENKPSESHHYLANSTMTFVNHPVILSYINERNLYNKHVISDVCKIIKSSLPE